MDREREMFPSAYERAEESPPTARGLEAYLDTFLLKREDLDGKDILDLGSGKSLLAQDFEAERRRGTIKGGRVYSLDAQSPQDDEEWSRDRLRALAQELPLKNESLDLILANHSVPLWIFGRRKGLSLPDPAKVLPEEHVQLFAGEMKHIFDEAARVLKPGGRALFAPYEVYYGSHYVPQLGNAPFNLKEGPYQQHLQQLMKAMEVEIRNDEERRYETFVDTRGNGIIHLVKERAERTDAQPTAPPDSRTC